MLGLLRGHDGVSDGLTELRRANLDHDRLLRRFMNALRAGSLRILLQSSLELVEDEGHLGYGLGLVRDTIGDQSLKLGRVDFRVLQVTIFDKPAPGLQPVAFGN